MDNSIIYSQSRHLDWADSVKGILIFLVVLGHLIGSKVTDDINIITLVHYLIYSVFMPVFIFISGYFSKKKSSFEKIFKNFLVPYAVFDLAYVIFSRVVQGSGNFNILFPTYLYWYILCLALMRMSVEFMDKTKLAYLTPVISVALCCFCPENIWRFLSFGRVILLYPMFYLGYKFNENQMSFFRKNKIASFVLGVIGIVVELLLLKFNVVDTSFAAHDYPSDIKEHFAKILVMILSIGSFALLAAFVPENVKFLKRWGKNSLIVYLVHSYAVVLFGKVFVRFNIESVWVEFVICFISAIIITEILSLDVFSRLYKKIFGYINKGIDFVKSKIVKS